MIFRDIARVGAVGGVFNWEENSLCGETGERGSASDWLGLCV